MSSPPETAPAPPRDWAVATLRDAGCPDPESDADLLIADGVSFPIFERVQLAATAPSVNGFRFTSESFLSYYDIWKSAE